SLPPQRRHWLLSRCRIARSQRDPVPPYRLGFSRLCLLSLHVIEQNQRLPEYTSLVGPPNDSPQWAHSTLVVFISFSLSIHRCEQHLTYARLAINSAPQMAHSFLYRALAHSLQ